MPTIVAGGHHLDAEMVAPARPDLLTVVFLHEGLGSRQSWRDFPRRLHQALGVGTLAYSRWGYGTSDPRAGDWPVSFMHDEAIDVLPEVLSQAGLAGPPVLFGHSDGGSIALIFASRYPNAVHAVVTEAAHVVVEDVTCASIAAAGRRFSTGGLRPRLAKHHGDKTDSLFSGWSGVWVSPAFRQWDIRPLLPGVRCPVLAIQGRDDPYGTTAQLDAIAAGVGGPVSRLLIDDCGHVPHAEKPGDVLSAVEALLSAWCPEPIG